MEPAHGGQIGLHRHVRVDQRGPLRGELELVDVGHVAVAGMEDGDRPVGAPDDHVLSLDGPTSLPPGKSGTSPGSAGPRGWWRSRAPAETRSTGRVRRGSSARPAWSRGGSHRGEEDVARSRVGIGGGGHDRRVKARRGSGSSGWARRRSRRARLRSGQAVASPVEPAWPTGARSVPAGGDPDRERVPEGAGSRITRSRPAGRGAQRGDHGHPLAGCERLAGTNAAPAPSGSVARRPAWAPLLDPVTVTLLISEGRSEEKMICGDAERRRASPGRGSREARGWPRAGTWRRGSRRVGVSRRAAHHPGCHHEHKHRGADRRGDPRPERAAAVTS